MQNTNYQIEMDKIIKSLNGRKPSLLLHVCCAPCSSYVFESIAQYFDITVLYYNPNITPKSEYIKRYDELMRLIGEANFTQNIKVMECNYNEREFFDAVNGLEDMPEGGERCEKCYRLRLEETVKTAKEQGFEFFTTTLSISPYKNSRKLAEISMQLAEQYGVKWLPSDFKKRGGYKRSIELSQEYGLYRQNYCGCIFSMPKT